jgi:hypothetical protein
MDTLFLSNYFGLAPASTAEESTDPVFKAHTRTVKHIVASISTPIESSTWFTLQ